MKKKLVSKGYLPYDITICHLHALLEKTTYRDGKGIPGMRVEEGVVWGDALIPYPDYGDASINLYLG